MSCVVYYFTGSGNSLAVAQDLAEKLNGKKTAIASLVKKESIQPNCEVIGIVFPVYFANFNGVPFIVQRFIRKLQGLESKYLFAVCTHAGGPAATIEKLRKIIEQQDGKLAGGFTVQMTVPYSARLKIKHAILGKDFKDKKIIEQDKAKRQKLFDAWEEKLNYITKYIGERTEGEFETIGLLSKLFNGLFLPFNRLMFKTHYKKLSESGEKSLERLVQKVDNSFEVNENCIACGTCEEVCPVNNIKLVDNRPEWMHHCENCLACYCWCPANAIGGEVVRYNKKEHHPNISLADMKRHY